MEHSTATLLGYTEDELQANFPDYIEQLAIKQGKTIKSAENMGGLTYYHLGDPNKEITLSFSLWLAQDFAHLQSQDMGSTLRRLLTTLNNGNIDETLETLKIE